MLRLSAHEIIARLRNSLGMPSQKQVNNLQREVEKLRRALRSQQSISPPPNTADKEKALPTPAQQPTSPSMLQRAWRGAKVAWGVAGILGVAGLLNEFRPQLALTVEESFSRPEDPYDMDFRLMNDSLLPVFDSRFLCHFYGDSIHNGLSGTTQSPIPRLGPGDAATVTCFGDSIWK